MRIAITATIDAELHEKIKKEIELGNYKGVSAFIQEAINLLLQKEKCSACGQILPITKDW